MLVLSQLSSLDEGMTHSQKEVRKEFYVQTGRSTLYAGGGGGNNQSNMLKMEKKRKKINANQVSNVLFPSFIIL